MAWALDEPLFSIQPPRSSQRPRSEVSKPIKQSFDRFPSRMAQKSRPGPVGTSCLTCKRRHKKCDQRQPICERCEAGHFECLGYGHIKGTPMLNYQSTGSSLLIAPDNDESSPRFPLLEPGAGNETLEGHLFSEEHFQDTEPTAYFHNSLISANANEGRTISDPLPEDDGTSTVIISKPRRVEDYLHLFTPQPVFKATDGPMSILHKIINFQIQFPYSSLDPLKTFLNSHWFIDYILAQSDKIAESWYFKPTNYQGKHFLEGSMHRLQTSGFHRWITLVALGVVQSFLAGDMTQCSQHRYWIEHIENSAKRELTRELAPGEMQDRRSDWVHVLLMKSMITQKSNIYQILRTITPTFLQVVYSDPRLWPYGCNPAYIPLSKILVSEAQELAFFALMDCTCAMAFGLSQQVEYDTAVYSPSAHSPPHQWAHSTPAHFQLLLADINACRDKSPNAREWREIERCLQTWRFQSEKDTFTESWMTIAWYAVQESWRLALLAYLYMAVCETSSNDSRVQSCIKQVLQVIGIVKEHGLSSMHVSFFVQYLIVGICARTEAHRKVVYEKLSARNTTRFWFMRAADFVPVLEHLWHGAAADGRPIKWSDYMRSREIILPVAI